LLQREQPSASCRISSTSAELGTQRLAGPRGFQRGLIALTGIPGGGGILSAAIEHSANPAEPIEAYGLTRRLMALYPNRLYLEIVRWVTRD
jgi:hypothetical protein